MPSIPESRLEGPYFLREQGDSILAPNEIARRIVNMYLLEEQTLRSIWGPTTYVPQLLTGLRPESREEPVTSVAPFISPTSPLYGFRQHGIFHCVMASGRELLLLHTGDQLWEWQGWERNWRRLISPTPSSTGISGQLLDSKQSRPPTQFTFTGNGVVIVPQQGRAYFYDGNYIAPLGFSQTPASPLGVGPSSTGDQLNASTGGVNNIGYAHTSARAQAVLDHDDGTPWSAGRDYATGPGTEMTDGFGSCRIGTLTTLPISDPENLKVGTSGWVEQGQWRCAVQFVDMWGNLSPLSPASNPVRCDLRPAVLLTDPAELFSEVFPTVERPAGQPATYRVSKARPDSVRIQVKWEGIPTGPERCVGRRLYRTKDIENTGDSSLYYLTQNALATSQGFATLPDNVVTMYPDNIPDGWLTEPAKDVLPVPRFSLCTMALGRLWIAGMEDDPATIRPSEAGFWGTFPAGNDLTPDPMSHITGLHAVPNGLLVCTTSSTFLVESSDDGKAFKYRPVSSEIGCAAPSSMASLPDGKVMWLGFDGFYSYNGSTVTYESLPIRKTLKRLTLSRLAQAVGVFDQRSREYRCWVSLDGDVKNTHCFIYDGAGWRERDDMVVDSVCTTQDHRGYTLVGGHLPNDGNHSGVYLLDHAASPDLGTLVENREALIETAWLNAQGSDEARTSYVIYLWLRETEDASVTIEVMRNWRGRVVETTSAFRYSRKDIPDFWKATRLNSGAAWKERRPYWTRAAVHVPSAEAVRFRIRGTGTWEFIGFQVQQASRYYGGAQMPP